MIFAEKIFVVLMFAAISLISCNQFYRDANRYFVSVKYVGGEGSLENVSVVIGSDKFWWSRFDRNEEKAVVLSAEKSEGLALVLLYTLNGKPKTWESSELSANRSYRVELEIDGAGVVKEKFCEMPCRF